MRAVVRLKFGKDGVLLRGIGPGGNGAGDELLRAVADEHTHLVQRVRGIAEGGERMVDTGMQIGQRVKERPVQIKNCKLIHGSILSFGVI